MSLRIEGPGGVVRSFKDSLHFRDSFLKSVWSGKTVAAKQMLVRQHRQIFGEKTLSAQGCFDKYNDRLEKWLARSSSEIGNGISHQEVEKIRMGMSNVSRILRRTGSRASFMELAPHFFPTSWTAHRVHENFHSGSRTIDPMHPIHGALHPLCNASELLLFMPFIEAERANPAPVKTGLSSLVVPLSTQPIIKLTFK